MKKGLQLLLCLIAVTAWMGCAAKQPPPPLFEKPSLAAVLESGEYVQVVDNFLILLDTSHSMRDKFDGQQKFHLAQSVILSLNETIAGMELNGGLRTFGHLSLRSAPRTRLVLPVQPHSPPHFAQVVKELKSSFGSTPMHQVLTAASDDLANLQGRTAIIIISDGVPTGESPMAAARMLQERYGDDVCISSITIGRSGAMAGLTSQTRCGKFCFFHDSKTSQGMADFVTEVFFEKGPARPARPAPRPSAKVIINSVLFDFDSSAIKPQFVPVLREAARVLKEDPGKSVVVEGHTCSIGTAQYNQGLSERRADAVKKFLVDQGLAAARLSARGAGEERPVADNDTVDGRKRNRRVEFHVK